MHDARLDFINNRLKKMGLCSLSGRGDHTQGQIELIRIRRVCHWRVKRHSAPLFTDVVFEVMHPDYSWGWYTIRFNANSAKGNGAIVVALLKSKGQESKIALVRLWCPPHACWALEVPRGFRRHDDPSGIESASRLLQREVLDRGTITKSTHLRDCRELSRTHAVVSSVYLLEVEMPAGGMAALGGTDQNDVQLWTIAQIEADFTAPDEEAQIKDALSVTALTFALAYIRKHKADTTS